MFPAVLPRAAGTALEPARHHTGAMGAGFWSPRRTTWMRDGTAARLRGRRAVWRHGFLKISFYSEESAWEDGDLCRWEAWQAEAWGKAMLGQSGPFRRENPGPEVRNFQVCHVRRRERAKL